MLATTSLNTGKVSGVNKCLIDFYKKYHGRNIYSLECLFHANDIYSSHIIAKIEGKEKGHGTLQGALMKHFTDIQNPDIGTIVDREKLAVPITYIASLHLRKKAEWFSDKKKINEHQFRNDHMCLLALSCYLLMELPVNIKPLLAYKQEATCHARWLTTASGYLRLLIFNVCRLDESQPTKLIWLISSIVSVYVPSFVLIHLKPSAAEGPGIMLTLFQHNLLLAYSENDSELAEVALKYFYDHAQQWVTPISVALGIYAEVPPYSIEAVQTGYFPVSVDARKLLKEQKASLKDFFTLESKAAACILCSEVPVAHWRNIDVNRAMEKYIRKLKMSFRIKFVIPQCTHQRLIFVSEHFYAIWIVEIFFSELFRCA